MKNFNVQIEAWAPFAEEKNNRLTQRYVVALSKSTQIERVKENFNIFDFKLSEEDMAKIKELEAKTSLFFSHTDPNMVK